MRCPGRIRAVRVGLLGIGLLFSLAKPTMAQPGPGIGRDAIDRLRFPELAFDPPTAQEKSLESGVPVILLEDHSLPLVTLFARFRGGYGNLPRESYAATTALVSLIRSGGTTSLPPDSVDQILDHLALQVTFGGGGGSSFSSVNTLTKHLADAVTLWADLLKNPRFDSREVDIWRGRQLESVRRRPDNPGLLAFSEFNRLMFGDHPIGWEMGEADLTPERVSSEPLMEEIMEGWPSCPAPLPEGEPPDMRKGGGDFLVPRDLTQSTVVMAEPGGVSEGTDPDYFASRIGNSILGAGGLTSRIPARVRTEKGYAYQASSLWTAPARYEGIVGAITQTRSESTIAATRLMLDIMEEMRNDPPLQEEVDRVVDQLVNGFVFNFQTPAQIVARQMVYRAEGLPADWLEQFIREVQRVQPEAVRRVFQRYVNPDEMLILILGNPDEFDFPPETLGPVQIWEVAGGNRTSGSPRGGPPLRR